MVLAVSRLDLSACSINLRLTRTRPPLGVYILFLIGSVDGLGDEWHVAHAKDLQEESKLIEAGFEYVRYSDKDQVAIHRKRK